MVSIKETGYEEKGTEKRFLYGSKKEPEPFYFHFSDRGAGGGILLWNPVSGTGYEVFR